MTTAHPETGAASRADKLAEQEASGTRTGKSAGARRPRTGAADESRAARVTTKDAVEKALRNADGPMHISAIVAAIINGNLAPGLQGKTPAATIGAQTVTEANKPGGRFVKTDRATFDLRELNPRAAKKRPATKA